MSEVREYRQSRFRRPPGACELLLVRHGESAPARDDRPFVLVDGHGDPELSPAGREQAYRVAERLAHEDISAIYVTTLRRTVQTAAPLAARLGIRPQVERDLREVYLGEWEGGSFRRHVAEGHPIAQRMFAEQRWDVIPGAEPGDAFAARVRGAIGRIAATHPDQAVAVVSHGGVIGQVLAEAAGTGAFTFAGSDNAAISHLVVTGDRWIIRRFNDTAHLGLAFTTAAEPPT
ncbi:MAG TPA: histidine phosphatase family protein [Acidimicrobiales bacterium]